MTGLLHRLFVLFGNFRNLELFAERFVVEDVLLALDDVDVAGERLAVSDGELDRIGMLGKSVADHPHTAVKIGSDAVHLVGENEPRDFVAVGLAPDGLGLRLDTGDGVEQSYGSIENSKRTLDFNGEIHMDRRVDDVDAVLDAVSRHERR